MMHIDVEQGSEEWLQARRGCITGSRFKDCRDFGDGLTDQQRTYVQHVRAGELEEVARELAGYKAAPKSEAVSRCIKHGFQRIWSDASRRYALDVARERCGGTAPGKYQTSAMRQGREQEAKARRRYEIVTGYLVEEVGIFQTEDKLFGVSPDGLINDDGVLEVKTMVSSDTLFKSVADGDVSEYIDQCLGYLWLLGRKWVDLVLWCPDFEHLVIHRIERDENAIEQLESDLMDFARTVTGYTDQLSRALKGEATPRPGPAPAAPTDVMAKPAPAPTPKAAPKRVALPELF